MSEFSFSIYGFPVRIYEIVLPRRIVSRIIDIIEESFPIEACGILLGTIKGKVARVEHVESLDNILGSSRAFWFDERDWMQKIIEGKRKGYRYIGLFHSHFREDAIPSLSDRHRMLECPGEVWLIVAYKPGMKPSFTAWRIDDWGSSILKLKILIE